MREAFILSSEALRERLIQPAQVDNTAPEAEMPPYMESFLAHLRLLVGVPFDYLIPDARLLPDESIRFFYLDRSWTDRLVDGAIAVGKIGSREQAHHQAAHPAIQEQLDHSERIVRSLQQGKASFDAARASAPQDAGGVVTGFLLRSAAVSGWPHMEVRAFDSDLPQPLTAADMDNANNHQLRTLRLERLSPSVLLALFDGIPRLVWLEEPHHGVQFGFKQDDRTGQLFVFHRKPDGEAEASQVPGGVPPEVVVPMRSADPSVIDVAGLRRTLFQAQQSDPAMVTQTGSAALAIGVLNPPWRQRFGNTGSVQSPPPGQGSGAFVPVTLIAQRVDLLNATIMTNLVEQ